MGSSLLVSSTASPVIWDNEIAKANHVTEFNMEKNESVPSNGLGSSYLHCCRNINQEGMKGLKHDVCLFIGIFADT